MQTIQNETTEYHMARIANADRWVPACGGSEVPYLDRNGRKVVYVYNFATKQHGYLDCQNDIVWDDEKLGAV